ncbi:MAG: transposase [Anaerolineales bacterium]|jgi:putative transposase|nr:transposase [Anaerolineales bacterium]
MDNAWYFVTASTLNKTHILATPAHLNLWVQTLKTLALEFKIVLAAWTILQNHYHILFMPAAGRDLSAFMKRLHGITSRQLNLLDNQQGRKVWYSYWDTCIRGEHDFWTRLNYIHYNPVKHGYVGNPEDWEYSSYRFYLRGNDNGWLKACEQEYPVQSLFDDDKF